MNRRTRRAIRLHRLTTEELVRRLERLGPILWEPMPQAGRREGWAICPCCGNRDLFISVPLKDVGAI
jgi:hypothetical protein